ncbi:DUF952 domain-containing protein [Mycolicibacterium mengxianglii]|uniref:DUF952 domain-containing protein n=1 Tax=Mycolicibacterium mengxianglii TaxID=2736649 RepID=UPI0018EEDA57|nr:DUF952 domain-containing protein [Mycolicibacterium mengxianglii]
MTDGPEVLVHLCGAQEWASLSSRGQYRPASLADAGFIHLSTPEQVHLPANRLFAGRTDLVLVYLNPKLFAAPLRWEPGVPGDPEAMLFPHLYGPMPVEAVINVTPYVPAPDGSFPPMGTAPEEGST